MISAAKCCASAALPPLPKIKILFPLLRQSIQILAVASIFLLEDSRVALVVFKCSLN
jgi:hypothetical protein